LKLSSGKASENLNNSSHPALAENSSIQERPKQVEKFESLAFGKSKSSTSKKIKSRVDEGQQTFRQQLANFFIPRSKL
jgi:hypothetical protein